MGIDALRVRHICKKKPKTVNKNRYDVQYAVQLYYIDVNELSYTFCFLFDNLNYI